MATETQSLACFYRGQSKGMKTLIFWQDYFVTNIVLDRTLCLILLFPSSTSLFSSTRKEIKGAAFDNVRGEEEFLIKCQLIQILIHSNLPSFRPWLTAHRSLSPWDSAQSTVYTILEEKREEQGYLLFLGNKEAMVFLRDLPNINHQKQQKFSSKIEIEGEHLKQMIREIMQMYNFNDGFGIQNIKSYFIIFITRIFLLLYWFCIISVQSGVYFNQGSFVLFSSALIT